MAENFANNYQTTLASGIDSDDTSLTVTSATGAPSANFRILVDSEYMLVTNVAGTTFTVTRAAEGSSAASHSGGATLTHILTAGGLVQALTDAGGGGSGASVVGKTSSGASSETLGNSTHYCKKITVASAGTFISVGARLKAASAGLINSQFKVAVFADNAGAVGQLIGMSPPQIMYLQTDGGGTIPFHSIYMAVGAHVASSGDYWIAVSQVQSNSQSIISYDTGGSDRTYSVSGAGYWATGGSVFAQSDSTKAYDIFGVFLPD